MTLAGPKLRAVVNLLSDPLQAHAAAHLLAQEAKARGVLIADLVALATASTEPPGASKAAPAAAPAAPEFRDLHDLDDGRLQTTLVRRINPQTVGLIGELRVETEKAYCVRGPNGAEIWLPKSQAEHHGEDPVGRSIFVLSAWIARKKGLA
jgi:hypothetical protein